MEEESVETRGECAEAGTATVTGSRGPSQGRRSGGEVEFENGTGTTRVS